MSTAERRFVVDVVCAVRTPIDPDSDCTLHCCGNDAGPKTIAQARRLASATRVGEKPRYPRTTGMHSPWSRGAVASRSVLTKTLTGSRVLASRSCGKPANLSHPFSRT